MTTQVAHQQRRLRTVTRHAGGRLGRLAGPLVAAFFGLATSAAVVPAAFAQPIPIGEDSGTTAVAPVVIITGGMAGWQIILIAVGAALAAAAAAVFLDRKLAGRRGVTAA
jgi:hypothetical protein